MVAITPSVDQPAADQQLIILFDHPTPSARVIIRTDFMFEYLPNPTVTDMQPRDHLLGYDIMSV